MMRSEQTLLFDADDTLWENNVYFERAIAAFISYLDHKDHSVDEVREHLNAVERGTIQLYGYGLKSFRRSLIQCFEDLSTVTLTDEVHRRIESFAGSIADQEMSLLAGVAETLPTLAARHRLLVVTKGDGDKQRDKLARSGIADHFKAIEVLAEKHAKAYRELSVRHGLDASQTWMVGNSPRSDINPALEAGLNAVFVPHDFTWVLEHETLNPVPRGATLLQISGFSELLEHF